MKLGVPAHGHRAGALAPILRHDLGAEKSKHALGVVARRQGLDHRGAARRVKAGEKYGRLHLRRRHGKAVNDGEKVRGAADDERERGAIRLGLGLQAHGGKGREHPAHGPPPQGGIARQFDLHIVAGDDAEHQAARSAGIAEVERKGRGAHAADTLPPHSDPAVRPLHPGTERGEGVGRRRDVLGLEQPGDPGRARGERAQDQRAMGNRLVARHPHPPRKACG